MQPLTMSLCPARFFKPTRFMRFEDRFDGLFFCGVDEGARVHDEHVGFIRIAGDLHATPEHAAKHDFGVHEILGAAKGDHPDLGGWA